MKCIYLDNGSTTQVVPEVVEAMMPYFQSSYGNPSSIHSMGMEARRILDRSRDAILSALGITEGSIIFTSGGTESNNLAISGIAHSLRKKGNHIITSRIEHSSVLKPLENLEKEGFSVTRLNVDREGFVGLESLEKSITKKTILVTIQHANHEIGTLQDIGAIGRLCRERGIVFHTDACQSLTKAGLELKKQNIDMVTLNAHKIHGPKGTGCLYVGDGIRIEGIMQGGGQEGGTRSGTENVAGIAGFAKAVEIGMKDMNRNVRHMEGLRNILIRGLGGRLNGPGGKSMPKRLCSNVNVSFGGIEGEVLVAKLSKMGVCISTGSACASRAAGQSHVLKAAGLGGKEMMGSVRYTVSRLNTKEEVAVSIEKTKAALEQLREIYSSSRILA